MNSDGRGQAEGNKFGRGFARGAASGIKGIASSFVFASAAAGSLIRNIGGIALGIAVAARLLKNFSRGLLVASVGLRAVAGTGLAKLAGWLKVVSRLAGILARDVGRAAAAVLVLNAAARGLTVLTRAGRMMGLFTVGLATLIGLASTAAPALVSLAGALATVGSVAGGMAIAGLSTFAAALAGLKLGLSGVGDAFKTMGQASSGGASVAADNARQVQRAEKSLTKAVEAEQEAQEDVTKAREDARKKLQGLDRQLRGAAQSEKEAKLDLLDAQAELQKGDFENGRERARAVLAVEQAELNLQNVQADNNDLAKEAADARAKGVEGSDEVVDAQKRLRDATDATREAQQDLNDARNPKDQGGSAGVDKQAEALAKLSTNARATVLAVMGVKPAWDAMTKSVQNNLFAGLAQQVEPLANVWIPRLGIALGGVTTGFNTGARSVATWLQSSQGIATTSTWLDTSSQMASRLGVALGNIVPGLVAVAAGAGQAFAPMTQGLGDATQRLSNFLVEAQRTGEIKTFFLDAFNSIKTAVSNFMAVAKPLGLLFLELGQRTQAGLAPGLRSVGQAIQQATPGLIQMADKIMPALGQTLTNLAPVLPGLVHAFSPWATILSILAPYLGTIIAKLAPMAPYLLAAATAAKVIAVAYTAWNATMFAASVAQGIFAAALGRGTAGLAGNTIALGAYKAAQLTGTIITGIATGAVTAFGAALRFATGPIGLIIGAIALLVGGLVLLYNKNETFRNLVQAAWSGIKTAISAVGNWITGTLWPAIKTAWDGIASGAMWLWQNAIQPAWNGIKFAISIVWFAIQVYFKLWQIYFKALGAVAMWLWQNVIVPAWNGISAAISAVWNNVLRPIWDAWVAAFKLVGDTATWLWNNAIKPAWDAIKAGITVVWNVVKPIFENIGKGFKIIGDIAARVGDAMRNAFNGVVDVLKAPIHAVGALLAKVPDKIFGIEVPGASAIRSWGETMQSLRSGGVVGETGGFVVNARASARHRALLSAMGGKRIRGAGSGTSDSIPLMGPQGAAIARVSNGETYFTPGLTSAFSSTLGALNGGMNAAAALAAGGVVAEPYGLPTGSNISYGAAGFPKWIEELARQWNVKPSTYAGHQESDRNEKGYAPNPRHLNRGIDWSGTVAAMQKWAEHLKSIAPQFPQLEQIIWMNPQTGQKIGWAGGSPDSSGSYFASDYSGHQDHVHTRQSAAFGSTQTAITSNPQTTTTVGDPATAVWTETNGFGDSASLGTGDSPSGSGVDSSEPFDSVKTTRDLFGTWGKITGESLFDIFIPSQFADSIDPVAIADRYMLKSSTQSADKQLDPVSTDSPAKAKYKKELKTLRTDLANRRITRGQYDEAKAKLDKEYQENNKTVNVGSTLDGSLDTSITPGTANTQTITQGAAAAGASNKPGRDNYVKDIAAAVHKRNLPLDAAIIAVGTALVESELKMYANSKVPESLKLPHDAVGSDGTSVGLFQQQQNGAWGSLAQNMNAFASAGLFLDAMLKKYPNWASMQKGAVAQGVQQSAFPAKYEPRMPEAQRLLIGKFDRGGVVPPGVSVVENKLRRYEQAAVFTPHQWDTLQALPNGGGTTIDARTVIEQMVVDDWRQAQRELKQLGQRNQLRYSRSHKK